MRKYRQLFVVLDFVGGCFWLITVLIDVIFITSSMVSGVCLVFWLRNYRIKLQGRKTKEGTAVHWPREGAWKSSAANSIQETRLGQWLCWKEKLFSFSQFLFLCQSTELIFLSHLSVSVNDLFYNEQGNPLAQI